MKKVYGLAHVTGYTSEADITLFYKQSDAIQAFEQLKKNTLFNYIEMQGWELDILKMDLDKLEEDYCISIDGLYDITWDSFEVYERIYIVELEIN